MIPMPAPRKEQKKPFCNSLIVLAPRRTYLSRDNAPDTNGSANVAGRKHTTEKDHLGAKMPKNIKVISQTLASDVWLKHVYSSAVGKAISGHMISAS